MRFVLGLVIGFGVGFAGAILMAPEKQRGKGAWFPPVERNGSAAAPANGAATGVQRAMQTLRQRVAAAREEAKAAAAEAEREMKARYEKMTGRRPSGS